MNIQLPIAGLTAQQGKPGLGSKAEATTGDSSFAAILNQAGQPSHPLNQESLVALKSEALKSGMLKGETPLPQGLLLQAVLENDEALSDLNPEFTNADLDDELSATDLPIAAPADDADAVALPNVQALQREVSSQTAVASTAQDTKQVAAAIADSTSPVRTAALHTETTAQALAAEGSNELTIQSVETAAKPNVQSALEGNNMNVQAAGNTQSLAVGAVARSTLTAPLASPQWQNDLSQQVSSFALRGDGRVSMQLNPADLGPLLVELRVTDQGAQLQFISAQATVRSAVEQALPQLRDALAEQGIDLGDVNVGEQSRQQEQSPSARQTAANLNTSEGELDITDSELNAVLETGAPLPGQLSVYA